MKPLLLALCLCASPVWAQTPEDWADVNQSQIPVVDITAEEWARINTLVIAGQPPTIRDQVDMGFMLGSASMSSIALGLTMSCTAAGTCRELNQVMDKFLGDGPVPAVVFKSVANGAIHYGVWRFTKGKTRTLMLATLFAVNTFDAIHDIREMRKIQGRR